MIDTNEFTLLSLVLMRMSGFILLNPILGRKNMTAIVKTGFIVLLTYVVYSAMDKSIIIVNTPLEFGILLLKEFAVGYVIGFVISLFLYVIIFAGEIMDMQMGLSMSKIYDVSSNASLSLSATFFNIMFMLMFFISNGHLTLIKIMVTSQNIIPFGHVVISPDITSAIIDIFCQCTVLAVKFALPIIAIELLVEMGMGILMKTIPQINVFVISMQAKMLVGLVMILILFSPLSSFVQNLIVILFETLEKVIIIMK